MNKLIISIIVSAGLMLAGCDDSYDGLEIHKLDNIPPKKVEVKKVIPKSGAVEIKFSLSKGDSDVTQVVASYIKNGQKVEFNVSRYSSSILVEGFIGTSEQNIELVCVDNSGNISEPVTVTVSPLESPVETASKSIRAIPTFGGVKLDWKNTTGDFLAIHVLTNDTAQIKGQDVFIEDPSKLIYTRDTVPEKTYAYVRGYENYEQKFGFVISDKWGNRSDTSIFFLTPLKEDLILNKYIDYLNVFDQRTTPAVDLDYDKEGVDPFTGIQRDGPYYPGAEYKPKTLFDDQSSVISFMGCRYVKNLSDPDVNNREICSCFSTYDLNVDVVLRRMKIWWRTGAGYRYAYHSVKKFRIWGTNDENQERFTKFPEGWTLVGEFDLPDPVNPQKLTSEEISIWDNGMDVDIAEANINPEADTSAKVRYIRIEIIDNYGGANRYTWNEMKLWGAIAKKYYTEYN